jgi:hypothetical protein
VLTNDILTTDATVIAVSAPAHGSTHLNGDGTITFTPAIGFSGMDGFTYAVSNAQGHTDLATVTVSVIQSVQIDIKPDCTTNAINLNNDGMVTVAVFSTAYFNAVTVDVASVRFAGAAAVHSNLEDINRDDRLDLVLHFRITDTNLPDLYKQLLLADASDGTLDTTRNQAMLRLTGATMDGGLWEGLDAATLFMSGNQLDDLLIARSG